MKCYILLIHNFLKYLFQHTYFYPNEGGTGQRKLSVVPTEAEGYTAMVLKSASNNGKYIMYIVPLQEQIDVSPLPHDAPEFAKMPKSVCKKCGVSMPLQFLALHIQGCSSNVCDDNDDSVSCQILL